MSAPLDKPDILSQTSESNNGNAASRVSSFQQSGSEPSSWTTLHLGSQILRMLLAPVVSLYDGDPRHCLFQLFSVPVGRYHVELLLRLVCDQETKAAPSDNADAKEKACPGSKCGVRPRLMGL